MGPPWRWQHWTQRPRYPHPYGRPGGGVPRLLSLTGGWKETSLRVFSKCASVLLAPLAIQLPLRPKSLRRKHLPPAGPELVLPDRSTSRIPEGLELSLEGVGGRRSTPAAATQTSSQVSVSVKAVGFQSRRQADNACHRHLQNPDPASGSIWGRGGGRGASRSPFSQQTTTQPRCVGGPRCPCQLACRMQCAQQSGSGA